MVETGAWLWSFFDWPIPVTDTSRLMIAAALAASVVGLAGGRWLRNLD